MRYPSKGGRVFCRFAIFYLSFLLHLHRLLTRIHKHASQGYPHPNALGPPHHLQTLRHGEIPRRAAPHPHRLSARLRPPGLLGTLPSPAEQDSGIPVAGQHIRAQPAHPQPRSLVRRALAGQQRVVYALREIQRRALVPQAQPPGGHHLGGLSGPRPGQSPPSATRANGPLPPTSPRGTGRC